MKKLKHKLEILAMEENLAQELYSLPYNQLNAEQISDVHDHCAEAWAAEERRGHGIGCYC